jgi:hypothetical protein
VADAGDSQKSRTPLWWRTGINVHRKTSIKFDFFLQDYFSARTSSTATCRLEIGT